MFETCRACLKSLNVVTCPYFQFDIKSLSNIERDKFNTVIPEMDLNIPNQIFFCESCHTSLENAYQFKTQCLQTEEIIKKYLNSKCVINLEDFDLKAVAFECGDVMKDNNVLCIEDIDKQFECSDVMKDENVLCIEDIDKQFECSDIMKDNSIEEELKNEIEDMNDQVEQNPILSEILTSNSDQFEDLSSELEIKEESDITIVSHEVGNFFSNQEEVVPARNNVLYPDNNKIYKESVLYSLLQNKSPVITSNYYQNQTLQMDKTVVTTNPLSHIIHNNFQHNRYANQNNYFIINNTSLAQINPVLQNIQELKDVAKVQKHNTHNAKSSFPIHHTRTMDSVMENLLQKSSINDRDLSQINPIFENIPNHYIYKKRKLEEAEVQVVDDDSNLSLDYDTSKSKPIEIDLTNVCSEEIIVTESVENYSNNNPLPEPFQGKKLGNFPILKDIIDTRPDSPNLDSCKPAKAQVIPHLRKFFVCEICGKLLSTRFYAFHMKRHKRFN